MAELHLIGTYHLQGHSAAVTKELQSRRVKRIGVEELHKKEAYKSSRPDFVFWKEIHDFAVKHKIKLVPLAEPLGENPLAVFHSILGGWVNRNARTQARTLDWNEFRLNIQKNKKNFSITTQTQKRANAIVDEVASKYASPTFAEAEKLFHAVSVTRSLAMHDRAKALSVEHGVVGLSHAQHLEQLRNVKITRMVTDGKEHKVHDEIRDYLEHALLMEKMRAISEGKS